MTRFWSRTGLFGTLQIKRSLRFVTRLFYCRSSKPPQRSALFVVFQAVPLALSTMAASGFDDFKQAIGPMSAMGAASPFEVSVAGISEQRGPSGFRMTTLQGEGGHLEPWRVIDFPRGFSPCPCNSEADEQEIRAAIEKAPATLDGHAVAALTAQREIARRDFEARRQPCWVGGFAQITTISVETIATRIIHRWNDDVVGTKLAA